MMKFKLTLCALLGMFVSLTSCAQKKGAEMTENDSNAKVQESQKKGVGLNDGKSEHKILVAYFSATGTTRRAAADLADVMGGTLHEITPEKPYSEADLDWTDSTSRSSVEMHDTAYRPPITDKVEDMGQYDVVFLGFPIWWYIAPTIVNTFIESNDLEGKTVVCFATSGGSPVGPCVDNLKKQYPGINWTDGKLLNGTSRKELEGWKSELGL